MRQVPKKYEYLIVGGGRLARHLSHYFDQLSIPHKTWSRKENSKEDLAAAIKESTKTLLCIKDDEIINFYSNIKNEDVSFVHFSGALELDGIFGFHPLMTFGYELYDITHYQAIHFVGTHQASDFQTIFPELKNGYSSLSKNQKALYHSLCVLGGNGTTLLWDIVQQEFEQLGLPTDALKPYLKRISENIMSDHEGRWSGPWYRKDLETIQKNKTSLQNSKLKNLYSELEYLSQSSGYHHEK